jgi:AraC family transcriptional regulator, regulatory protein of adaptative response / methylated-DNA-[protein]-cysteine methyltransferase
MSVERVSAVSNDGLWRAVADRDPRADGLFVYGVTSTGVYCRPSCASRRPRRDRVVFFPAPAMAARAGYRPCRRCRPDQAAAGSVATPALDRVRRACEQVARRPGAHWTVGALARTGGISRVQLQRAFRGVLGLSPREYVAACRHRHFLAALRNGHGVTDAIYAAGYGSPSRVYGSIRLPGMTPATYGRGGRGAAIRWLTTSSPVGRILVAATARGLCAVRVGSSDDELRRSLSEEFPLAEIDERPSASLVPLAHAARAVAEAKPVPADLPLDIRGTAFQWRVWRALTRIPVGQTRSYAEVARAIGQPSAARAVARACATNPVALVVPCHRVVPGAGGVGGYRWGAGTKAKLLAAEKR